MNPDNTAIANLHHCYRTLTGFDIRIDYERERAWFEWAKRGNTQESLILVVKHLKKLIKKGERNPACLKFHNLIGQPDYFEEDLALAKAMLRLPTPTPNRDAALRATGRTEEPKANTRTAAQVVNSEAFKAFVALRKTL